MQKDLSLSLGILSDKNAQMHTARVWAPYAAELQLEIIADSGSTLLPMQKDTEGFFSLEFEHHSQTLQYYFWFSEEKKFPDPASRYQPQGVNGPSQISNIRFPWEDQTWSGLELDKYIIYELHVGTFSPEGTFDAIIPFLNELQNLGITAIELMPVSQFPGKFNWGYDGAFPFAVQNSYGGPAGLKRFVNACHKHHIAVVIDLAFNRIGSATNMFAEFGPYFSPDNQTMWGKGLNLDEAFSHHVRRYFIENTIYWLTEFHIDAIRLGALQTISDKSAYPFLNELTDHVHALSEKLGREIFLIAESDLNNTRIILPQFKGGYELDAQWNDDYHHSLHTLLTHERTGYYEDYGKFQDFLKAYREGFVYTGQYSRYRKRPHGCPSKHIDPQHFIVYLQNHDQIGNRYNGERLSELINFSQLKLAAAITILSPYIPLIFMGEEYAELSPFQYFSSSDHSTHPTTDDEKVFERCKLNHHLKKNQQHGCLWSFYQQLIKLRKTLPALAHMSRENMILASDEKKNIICLHRKYQQHSLIILFHFNGLPTRFNVDIADGNWDLIFDAQEPKWLGDENKLPQTFCSPSNLELPPYAFCIYEKQLQ